MHASSHGARVWARRRPQEAPTRVDQRGPQILDTRANHELQKGSRPEAPTPPGGLSAAPKGREEGLVLFA